MKLSIVQSVFNMGDTSDTDNMVSDNWFFSLNTMLLSLFLHFWNYVNNVPFENSSVSPFEIAHGRK